MARISIIIDGKCIECNDFDEVYVKLEALKQKEV